MADPKRPFELDHGEPHDGELDGVMAEIQTDPDPELSLSGIVWSSVAIIGITAVSMVLMWWLGGGLISQIDDAQAPLTPAQAAAAEAVLEAGEARLEAGERPDLPGLVLPAEYPAPPGPQLETTLRGNIDRLRARESEILDRWGWNDEASATVHVPIAEAIALAAAGELPGFDPSGHDRDADGDDDSEAAANDDAGADGAASVAGEAGEEVRDAA